MPEASSSGPILFPKVPVVSPAESGGKMKPEEGKLIFKASSSLIPALALGWMIILLFFFLFPVAMLPNPVSISFLPPLFTLGILVIVILFIWQMGVALTTRYSVTTRGVKINKGLFRRSHQFILLSDLAKVTCQRTTLQKIAGLGNLVLDSKTGDSEKTITLVNLTRCEQKAQKLQPFLSGKETA